MLQFPELNALIVEIGTSAVKAPIRARSVIQTYSSRIKDSMKSFAPVDTGTLRESITYETTELQSSARGEIGPTARHGRFVEWGTSKMGPRAFAGPALDRHSADFVEEIANEVADL